MSFLTSCTCHARSAVLLARLLQAHPQRAVQVAEAQNAASTASQDHEAELQGLRASMSAAQGQTAAVERERDGLAEQALQAQEQQLQVDCQQGMNGLGHNLRVALLLCTEKWCQYQEHHRGIAPSG